MSSQKIKSGPSTHGNVHNSNSYSSCFPCDGSVASSSSTSAMQLDVPRRRQEEEGQGCVDSDTAMSEGSSTESAFMPPRPRQPQQQTGPTNNVGELVTKAKKAAVSLWMILHAQNCRQSEENCPHRGCSETKLLLVHVKTCQAGPNVPCPTQCKGCNETRKLLAHYRRCKDMRMKQVGLGRRSGLQPDQSCLVCSLMARYAKSMMDRTKHGSSPGKNHVSSLLSTSSMDGKFNVEKGLTANFPRRTPSMALMPPPPPRCRSVHASSPNKTNFANESFEIPHNPSFPKTATVADITDPYSSAKSSFTDPSLLGKSVDSSVRVPFPILRHTSREAEAVDVELIVPGLTTACIPRQRAESYDERHTQYVKFAPTIIKQYYFDDEQKEEEPSVSMPQRSGNTRPRSASLGCNNGNMKPSSARRCETIAEEGVEQHEEPLFPND